MAASEDGEKAASSLPEGCKAFLSCTSTGMAELELTEQLEDLGVKNIHFAHGTIIALHAGVLL